MAWSTWSMSARAQTGPTSESASRIGAGWHNVVRNDRAFQRRFLLADALGCVGADSRVHVVWQDGENVGATSSTGVLMAGLAAGRTDCDPGTEASTPSVAVDATGVIHVRGWIIGTALGDLREEQGRGRLGDETRLSAAAGASLVPTIAAGASCGLCVVWTDTRSGTGEVYFRERAAGAGVDVGQTKACTQAFHYRLRIRSLSPMGCRWPSPLPRRATSP